MATLPDLPQTEVAIVEMTNAFRKDENLGPVKVNKHLAAAARWFAQYLARTGKFAHEADGREPADRTRQHGYRHCIVAENLASNLDSRGFETRDLARQVMRGWRNSRGHRYNLTLPDVTEIGVAVVRAPDDAPKFISVQLLGRPDSLAFQFQIRNESSSEVAYMFGGKSQLIGPHYRITHKTCLTSKITFERAGGWLTGTRLGIVEQPVAGAVFRIGEDKGGYVHVVRELPAAVAKGARRVNASVGR